MLRRRLPRTALAYLLAIPVVLAVYLSVAVRRAWTAARPPVALVLGATVIGTFYADLALRRAPATPMRAAVALGLAIVLLAPSVGGGSAVAAPDPASAVIVAARSYLGTPYKLGTEGPNLFDCSGFIYRAFKDAGELPRIGGMRLRAVGYMRWFVARGLFTRDADKAEPGDLVVWDNGSHAGIYLGDGKAISALKNPWGITIHSITGLGLPLTYFLKVNWREGDGAGNGKGNPDANGNRDRNRANGNGNGDGDTGRNGDGGPPRPSVPNDPPGLNPPADAPDRGRRGVTIGTLNVRRDPDPNARIVGWIARGREFNLVDTGRSPSGWLWYRIETASGKQGWIWSYWTRPL